MARMKTLVGGEITGYTEMLVAARQIATMTTSAEMIKPWNIGRTPAFFILEKEVFRPIAAKAQTTRSLLAVFEPDFILYTLNNIIPKISRIQLILFPYRPIL